jgi:hypothetical protein
MTLQTFITLQSYCEDLFDLRKSVSKKTISTYLLLIQKAQIINRPDRSTSVNIRILLLENITAPQFYHRIDLRQSANENDRSVVLMSGIRFSPKLAKY